MSLAGLNVIVGATQSSKDEEVQRASLRIQYVGLALSVLSIALGIFFAMRRRA